MRLSIFITAAEQIRAHARRDHPREACGLLLGREAVVETIVEAANVADDPTRRFEIDPTTLLRGHREARESGRALLGWYHSHPGGRAEPSAIDAARADEDGKVWLIVAGDTLRAFVARAAVPAARFDELELALVDPPPDSRSPCPGGEG